jgi:hypothetical protein
MKLPYYYIIFIILFSLKIDASPVNTATSLVTTDTLSITTTSTLRYDTYKYNNVTKGLGFVIPGRLIRVPKLIERDTVHVLIKAHSDPGYYRPSLEKLARLIKSKAQLPMFKGEGKDNLQVAGILKTIERKLASTTNQIFALSQYAKTGVRNPFSDTKCKLIIDPVPLTSLDTAVVETEELLSYLNETVTDALLSERKFDVVGLLYQVEKTLDTLLLTFTDRLIIVEGLTSHLISDKLPVLLQHQSCYNERSLDNIDIVTCITHEEGLSCIIDIEAQTQIETFKEYILINYRGVQLALQQGEDKLVRDLDNHWHILRCTYHDKILTDLDEYSSCSILAYDNICTENIENRDSFDLILTNCNFTIKEPQEIINSQNGTLIMVKPLTIKELDPTSKHTISTLNTQVPVLIQTNAILSVMHTSQKQIRPEIIHDSRIISYSYLSTEQINRLISIAARSKILTSIDTGDYIDLVQSILVLILAPGSLYGVVQCMKLGLFSNVCCKPRKNQAKDKTNYNINKRIVKNQTLEINKVGHQV